ncbi:hypothetical protein COCSUDRAFT_60000 [Coccomyxa subellipsoidea C-169]|uniref:BTB domain-containing protein n=1 Tax=Coccomyxa subellipsoidea (strain C-169) TaxID=574566 RepID=I0YJX0_COCSC|nr:hypothetical protein COCSUDRAFT_60000 [Coccomyxa subellipsoidea C-169]EIE18689.1 hypothetical protein COCSUDRAFT_60000 [Coccomyxa subellipsoidea C-169]|eukprot:XP_005643233.1 hypothetical protein COCSUDRAFT_60000 [Coccomyxa subellipsoidea C-169]
MGGVIVHDEEHLAHLASLFNNTRYSDMVLVAEAPWAYVEGTPVRRRFHCHRAILASRSSYFDRMFGSGMRETAESEVVLPDCPPEALEAVLRFCYMGECRLPRRDMLSLLVLADRLDIPDLTALAEKVVLNNVNQDTFGDYLDVASSRRLQRLEAKCIDFLLTNFEKAATQETLKRLSLETLLAVLQSDNLHVPSEIHVFHSVLSWLDADPARKAAAAQVLQLVRFPTMTQAELCQVGDHPLVAGDPLVQEMLLRAFIHVCNPPQPHALPPEIFSMTVEAAEEAAPLYRPRALTAAAAFEFTGALQFWRVPVSGVYRITARGAKAADGACRCGGRGAILSGLFSLEKGQQLRVLCGGMSARAPHGNSGGGGGTYVIVEDEDEPLIVAGGGGGTRGAEHDFDGLDASLEEDAMDSCCTNPSEQGLGGQYGCGGTGSPYLGLGGGGGGYRHPGAGGNATSANGRSLWASESADAHCAEYGGFGGGAGGCGGGGGGGFSGGGGGPGGGGGGSFIHYDALDISKEVGHEGHGSAEVVYVAPSARSLRTQILEHSALRSVKSAPAAKLGPNRWGF